jgi:16S rRNA (cytidine1402-2'-O)-methyltransferase
MTPGLYIVGTPIGNLDDLSPRALETLREVEAILTEDTRHTRILLNRYGLSTPMISCHKFNEAARLEGAIARIRGGAALALVTDSGMPAVSDPGARMVAACRRAGVPVTAVPGPSAVTTAVALSGFPAGGFVFAGFAPRKSGALRKLLGQFGDCPVPVVLFESPFRLLKLLEGIAEVCGDREVFVARELTKKFEETLTGRASEIRRAFEGRAIKGEIVVVLSPRVDSRPTGCYGVGE